MKHLKPVCSLLYCPAEQGWHEYGDDACEPGGQLEQSTQWSLLLCVCVCVCVCLSEYCVAGNFPRAKIFV